MFLCRCILMSKLKNSNSGAGGGQEEPWEAVHHSEGGCREAQRGGHKTWVYIAAVNVDACANIKITFPSKAPCNWWWRRKCRRRRRYNSIASGSVLSRVLSQGCYEQDLQDLDNFAHISSYPAHSRATRQWRTCWPPRGGRSRSWSPRCWTMKSTRGRHSR